MTIHLPEIYTSRYVVPKPVQFFYGLAVGKDFHERKSVADELDQMRVKVVVVVRVRGVERDVDWGGLVLDSYHLFWPSSLAN